MTPPTPNPHRPHASTEKLAATVRASRESRQALRDAVRAARAAIAQAESNAATRDHEIIEARCDERDTRIKEAIATAKVKNEGVLSRTREAARALAYLLEDLDACDASDAAFLNCISDGTASG